MVISKDTKPVRITGNNIDLTESLRDYVNEKLTKVMRRFGPVVSRFDVHLTVEHNPSVSSRHKAEVVAFSGKTILRTEFRSGDMYTSIDAVEERISRTIRKFKERKDAKVKGKDGSAAVALPDLDDDVQETDPEDVFTDVYQDAAPPVPPVDAVVKRKVFPMPLQTVEEAVLCCEYVDHPFYIFKNADTNQFALVYKRNHGGYGLIEPSNPDAVDDQPI